jgi:hypothetical protein
MDNFFPFVHEKPKKKKEFEPTPLYVELYPPPPEKKDEKPEDSEESHIVIIEL